MFVWSRARGTLPLFRSSGQIIGILWVMPLYEYRCNDCTTRFEVLRPIADRDLNAVCPRCESVASMPLISQVAALPGAAVAVSSESGPSSGGGCCGGACCG